MPVDFNKWRKQRATSAAAYSRGGDFYSIPEGTTILYVCPGPEPLGLPYLEIATHRNVGDKMVACFRQPNPGLWDEAMASVRAAKGVTEVVTDSDGNEVPLPCDVCDFLESGEASAEQIKSFGNEAMGVSPVRLFCVVPVGKVVRDAGGSIRREFFPDASQVPAVMFGPGGFYDDFCDAMDLNGDVTDPEAARYMLVTKAKKTGKGKGKFTYSAVVDPETVRQPVRLSKSLRAKVRDATAPGKACDLLRIGGNFVKSPDDVYNLLYGTTPADTAPEQPGADGPVRKGCFGSSVDYSPDDDECQHCAEIGECAAVAAPEGKKAAPPAAEAKPQPAPVQRQAPAKVTTTTKAAGKPTVVRGKPAPPPAPAPEPAPAEQEPEESDGTPGFDDDDIPDHQPPEEPEAPESPAEQPPAAEPKKVTPPPVTGRKSVSAEEFNRQIAARAAARKRGPQQ